MELPDYRLLDYPVDNLGQPLWGDSDGPAADYDNYVTWLSDYLTTATLDPAPHQEELCATLCELLPEQAMRSLGSDLGLDDAMAEARYAKGDWEDEDTEPSEWPHETKMPFDVGYRVPLALVLRPVRDSVERRKLLDIFFRSYTEYWLK
jgi:hypothetical protein